MNTTRAGVPAVTRLYYVAETGTLDLWVDEPGKEIIAEPLNDNIILKLDQEGNVVGLEIVDLKKLKPEDLEEVPKNISEVLKRVLRDITVKAKELAHTR